MSFVGLLIKGICTGWDSFCVYFEISIIKGNGAFFSLVAGEING